MAKSAKSATTESVTSESNLTVISNPKGSKEIGQRAYLQGEREGAQEFYREAHANGRRAGRSKARKYLERHWRGMSEDQIMDTLLSGE